MYHRQTYALRPDRDNLETPEGTVASHVLINAHG
jgi:hypothetical protein